MTTMKTCSIVGCGRPHYGRGLCHLHYQRDRHGTDMDAPVGFRHGFALAFIDMAVRHMGDKCLLWPFAQNGNGYGAIHYPDIPGTAARVVCTLAYGRPPHAGLDVAHSCGNKLCVAPSHLRWATRAENEADKLRHGRSNRGNHRSGRAKLTEADVRAIRASTARGIDLAKQYGVAQETISHIRHRQNWNWLED